MPYVLRAFKSDTEYTDTVYRDKENDNDKGALTLKQIFERAKNLKGPFCIEQYTKIEVWQMNLLETF